VIAELLLPHDVVVRLDDPVVVGREPLPPSDLPGAVAVSIAGDMSVSKTHALVESIDGTVWVTDLDSSNGSELIGVDGTQTRLSPGIPTVAAVGTTIRVGTTTDLVIRPAVSSTPGGGTWFHDEVSVAATRSDPIPPVPVMAAAPSPVGRTPTTDSHSPPADFPSAPVDDAGQPAAQRERRRQLGGWVLVVWGSLTTVLTLTSEGHSPLQSFPRSLFWYPTWLIVPLSTLTAVFPMVTAVGAGWMLRGQLGDERARVALWCSLATLPLLMIGTVDEVLGTSGNPIVGLTGWVLPLSGAVLILSSVDRALRPVRAAPAAGSENLPDGTAPAAHAYGLEPLPLGSRLGAYLLDGLLLILTLGIGWMVWSLIVWRRGQSPGKQAIGAVVVDADTGEVARFGTMAMRELVGKGILGTLTLGVTGIVSSLMVLFGEERRGVHDHIASTLVVRTDRTVQRS